MNELYTFKNNYFDLQGTCPRSLKGIRYHYLDEGTGEPVVMLHGNPTWSFFYRDLVKALRDSYHVIVPDHVGCGMSDKPKASEYPYTLERRVEDLEKLLAHLGIRENITLIVHDWGGMIGMTYAVRNPDAVRRFIVMNTAAFHLPAHMKFPTPLWIVRDTPLGALLVRGLNAFCLGAAAFCCTKKRMTPVVRQGYLSPYDSWDNRIAVLRFVQDIPLKKGDPSYDLVSKVDAGLAQFAERPVMLLWGEKDFVFDCGFLQQWIRRFPKAQVHRFADSGHYILEDSGTEIIPLIKDFLQAHPLER